MQKIFYNQNPDCEERHSGTVVCTVTSQQEQEEECRTQEAGQPGKSHKSKQQCHAHVEVFCRHKIKTQEEESNAKQAFYANYSGELTNQINLGLLVSTGNSE